MKVITTKITKLARYGLIATYISLIGGWKGGLLSNRVELTVK